MREEVEKATDAEAERDALKAEVERLKPSCLTCFGSGKVQTHPTIVCPKCGGTGKEWSVAWKTRAEKAEAELAAARPLLEAAERLEVICGNYNTMTLLDLGYAAVKYRDAALSYRAKSAENSTDTKGE